MVARDTRPRSGGGTRVAARAGAETLALGVSGVLFGLLLLAMQGEAGLPVAMIVTGAPVGVPALLIEPAGVSLNGGSGGKQGDAKPEGQGA